MVMVIVGEDDNEITRFIKVWLMVILSLSYCYTISKNVAKGAKRLITILPVISLFFYLPLHLTSAHLGGVSSFFIAFLANFKLLLFAFNTGPLCSSSSMSLPLFLAVSCLPIKITQKHSPVNYSSGFSYGAKLTGVAVLVKVYDYSEFLHPNLILALYCVHIYFMLEVILAAIAFLVRILFGLELEPPFDDPFLSTSLQNFWGRRWNLMVTSILRPTVYDPVVLVLSRPIGRKCAESLGVLSTFMVSAMMHELIFYYLNRARPTWEVTLFFVLHGVCLMVEINVKKALKGRFELPRLISRGLTIAFVMSTSFWLFFPQLVRSKFDERAFEECAALGEFVKRLYHNIALYV